MAKKKIHPYILIILTFVGAILFGCLLLAMPFATTSGKSIGFVDALFMSTSAVCVTGLSVINISTEFSIFGKIVMVILMEVGGLSFITIAVFFFTMLGAKIGLSTKYILRESLNQTGLSSLLSLVKKIVLISVIVQVTCALINLIPLCKVYDFWKALGVSLFHSAAAFNNAGFDIFGDNSMINYSSDIILNTTTIIMIVIGSMGFVVIDEVIKKRRWKKFSVHTKIAIITTLILIVLGTLLIKLTVKDESFTWLQAIFSSVTCRTAGFTTYDLSKLSEYPAAYIIFILLMLIGASPCSTGGGVKTTTIAVIFIAIFYFARGKKAKAFNRRIGDDNILKAFVLVSVAIAIVFIATFLVSAIQPDMAYSDGTKVGIDAILFEVSSAFSTTGLSMGITGLLNPANRILLCFIMFFGRLGPLTIIGVVNKHWISASKEEIQYVEENVIIG